MPLAPVLRSRGEPIRLCSPWDPAVDREASGPAWDQYLAGIDLDASRLVFTDEPTWFWLQALGPREMDKVRHLMPPSPHPGAEAYEAMAAPERADVDRDTATWLGEVWATQLRFGLLRVENLDWSAVQDRWMGVRCWSDDAIWSLGARLVGWLGQILQDITMMPEKKSSPSG